MCIELHQNLIYIVNLFLKAFGLMAFGTSVFTFT